MSVVTVGDYAYGPIHLKYGSADGHLRVDRFCSIEPDVTFVVGNEHQLDRISTLPFEVLVLGWRANGRQSAEDCPRRQRSGRLGDDVA